MESIMFWIDHFEKHWYWHANERERLEFPSRLLRLLLFLTAFLQLKLPFWITKQILREDLITIIIIIIKESLVLTSEDYTTQSRLVSTTENPMKVDICYQNQIEPVKH